MKLSGKIDAKEGQRSVRFGGWRGWLQWAVIAAVAVIVYVYVIKPGRPFAWNSLLYLAPGVAIIAATSLWNYWKTRRDLTARGLKDPFTISYTIEDAGFVIDLPEITSILKWPSVTELAPGPRHWFVTSAGAKYFVPKAFFATPDEERAFVVEFLGHMSPTARTASAKAEKFTAWE